MLDIHFEPEFSRLRMGNINIELGASVLDVLAALRSNLGKRAVENSVVNTTLMNRKGVKLKTRGDRYKFRFTFHPALHRLQVATIENTQDVRLYYKGISIGHTEGEILKSSPVLDFLKLEHDVENDVFFARQRNVWFIFEVKEVEMPQGHVNLDVPRAEDKDRVIQQTSKGLTHEKCEDCNTSNAQQFLEDIEDSSSSGESNMAVRFSTRALRPELCSALEMPENVAREQRQQTDPQECVSLDVKMPENREECFQTSSIDTTQEKSEDFSSSEECISTYPRDIGSRRSTKSRSTASEFDCVLKIPEKDYHEQDGRSSTQSCSWLKNLSLGLTSSGKKSKSPSSKESPETRATRSLGNPPLRTVFVARVSPLLKRVNNWNLSGENSSPSKAMRRLSFENFPASSEEHSQRDRISATPISQHTATTDVLLTKTNESEDICESSSPCLSHLDSMPDKLDTLAASQRPTVSEAKSSTEDVIASSSGALPLPFETGEPNKAHILARKSTISTTDMPLAETLEAHPGHSETTVYLPENDTCLPSLVSPEGDQLHGQRGTLSNTSDLSDYSFLHISPNSPSGLTHSDYLDYSIIDIDEVESGIASTGIVDTPTSREDLATASLLEKGIDKSFPQSKIATSSPLKESIALSPTDWFKRPTEKIYVLSRVVLFSESVPVYSTSVVSSKTNAIECVYFSFGQQTDEDRNQKGVVSRGINIGINRDLIPGCPKTTRKMMWKNSGLPTAYAWFLDILGEPDGLDEYKHGSNLMRFTYYRHGIDLVVQLRGTTLTVHRVTLHTAFPGHPDFSLYNRCLFRIQTPYELSQKTGIRYLTTFSLLEEVEKVAEEVNSPCLAGGLGKMYVGHKCFITLTSKRQIATITVYPYEGSSDDIKEVITDTAMSIPSWQPSANSYGLPNIHKQVTKNEQVISSVDSQTMEDDPSTGLGIIPADQQQEQDGDSDQHPTFSQMKSEEKAVKEELEKKKLDMEQQLQKLKEEMKMELEREKQAVQTQEKQMEETLKRERERMKRELEEIGGQCGE